MDKITLFLVLVSALMHATWNFILKGHRDKEVFTWWFRIVSALLYTPVFIYLTMRDFHVPAAGWYCLLASGFCHAAYWLFLGKTYTTGDLSQSYPLTRSAPVFVAVWAVLFLGERILFKTAAGIALVCLGGYVLCFEPSFLKQSLKPNICVKGDHWILGLITALFISFYSIIDKVGVGHVSPYIYIYLENLFSLCFLSLWILPRQSLSTFKKVWSTSKLDIFSGGILCLVSYLLILVVMVFNKVSYIVVVRDSSIIFSVILGCVILKEKNIRVRLFASAVILSGIALVVIS